MMIDRAALFTDILARNELRRHARLPLLDVRATFEREVDRALWAEHVLDHHETVRADILRIERVKRGPAYPASAGGRWWVEAKVRAALNEAFQARRRA